MCCPGCRAVAGMITENGLLQFYEQRTAFSPRPPLKSAQDTQRYAIYDQDTLALQFSSTPDAEGLTDARLLIGGVSCAACTWLIEQTLEQKNAVSAATLNLAQSRLDIRFNRNQLPVSEIFACLEALGYRVQPWQASTRREQAKREYRKDLRRLAVAGIGMMQVGMFSIALHAGDIQGISTEYQLLLRLVSLFVTAFVVVFSARGFFTSAWRHLKHGTLVMDLPVALAIGSAFVASCFATWQAEGDVYFDSVVMFTFLLLLARFVEKRLRYQDTLQWEEAEQSLPDAVQRWNGEHWEATPRKEICTGERILLRPGDTVPLDGIVTLGKSTVREDSFSGESIPRVIASGAKIHAGTINISDAIEFTTSGAYADTRLAALQRSIDSARLSKPALARLADRIASRFIAIVLLATLTTALLWWQISPDRAFWTALSVLVISCPCALSLATPASLANASALLRRLGILVHGENALEAVARIDTIIFDKTGTLTTGDFEVHEIEVLDSSLSRGQVLELAAALQKHSNHPVASAFSDTQTYTKLKQVRNEPGFGIKATWQNDRSAPTCLTMGSATFCQRLAPDLPAAPIAPLYWVALCNDSQPLAWFGLSDALRAESKPVVSQLQNLGMSVEMLSGDSSSRATELGRQLGFNNVQTALSPQQKLERVVDLQQDGRKVLMVGDGLNDAPVLTRADASVAVSGATDLAKAQADFVIIEGHLGRVLTLIDVARRTRRVMWQNLAWALGYNALGIPLAALGWVPPWAAALGMSLSSLIVVANSTRLRHASPLRFA